jgi:hypothetical protein
MIRCLILHFPSSSAFFPTTNDDHDCNDRIMHDNTSNDDAYDIIFENVSSVKPVNQQKNYYYL